MTAWKTLELGEVCTLQRGMDLPKRMRTDGAFPLVTSSGIDGTHSVGPIKGPGVVTGRYGTIGKVFFVESDFWPLNTTLYVRDFHESDPRFVHYLLQTVDFQSHSGKSGVPGVNRNDIHQEFVHIPADRSEQETIARALLDADALIDSLEQLLTKKRQIKQGALQKLLTGKRRLPGFSDPWRRLRLHELGTFLKGTGIKRDEAATGDLPCVRYGEIYTTHSDHIRSFHSWISRSVASTATKLQLGDLLFAGSGETKEEIGKCVAFLGDVEAYAGGDIVILRPSNEVNSMFMGYLLNMPAVVRQKASRGQGDAVVHISATALGDVRIELPPSHEQKAIAQVLSDLDTEIEALELRLTNARALKQAMAQALLTGHIRLVEPNA